MLTQKLLTSLRRWRARQAGRREWGTLSDYALADIGLTRADLACVIEGPCQGPSVADRR